MAYLIGSATLRAVGETFARPYPVLVCEYTVKKGEELVVCDEDIREGDDFQIVFAPLLSGEPYRQLWCVDHRDERED